MRMHKFGIKKLAAGTLSVILSASMVMTAMAAEPDSGKQEDPDRNQTVYVTTDENGNTEKIIVSNHLNNRDGKDQLIDYSTLTDIENVKGDEEYTQDGDKLTWKADGSDIYYQGVSNEELPVSVTYSYKLDGKDVTADELAGKSGTVTIRVDYKNNNKLKLPTPKRCVEP